MNLVIDLDTQKFKYVSKNDILFKDGLTEEVCFQFVRNCVVQELDAATTVAFAIKGEDDFNGAYLAYSDAWTKTGSGETTKYTMDVDLNTVEMVAAIGSKCKIDVSLELEWVELGETYKTYKQYGCVENSVIDGSSAAPTPVPAASHVTDTNNPHSVTASQLGLGDVDNTSDTDKPVSTAQQVALDAKLAKVGDEVLVKTAYEANANTNAFTDAEQTKLSSIESGATADQTGAEIKAAYEAEANTNAFTDAEKTKLAGIAGSSFLGTYVSLGALQVAHPTASEGNYADVDGGVGNTVQRYIWDNTDSQWVSQGAGGGLTGADIKLLYEGEPDTNAFTDSEQSKLGAIEAGATGDQTGSEIKAAYEAEADTNAFTDAEKSKLAGIAAGASDDQTPAEIKTAYESNANTNAFTDSEKTQLSGIENGATADQTDEEIETAYNNRVGKVSAGEITAGTEATVRRYSPADIKSFVDTHAGAGGATNLSYVASTRTIESDTGSDAILPLAVSGGDAGLLSGSNAQYIDELQFASIDTGFPDPFLSSSGSAYATKGNIYQADRDFDITEVNVEIQASVPAGTTEFVLGIMTGATVSDTISSVYKESVSLSGDGLNSTTLGTPFSVTSGQYFFLGITNNTSNTTSPGVTICNATNTHGGTDYYTPQTITRWQDSDIQNGDSPTDLALGGTDYWRLSFTIAGDGSIPALQASAPKQHSETEYDTGRKWHDGRTIYSKVVVFTTGESDTFLDTNLTTKAHGISNFDRIINRYGGFGTASDNYPFPFNNQAGTGSGDSFSVDCTIDGTNITSRVYNFGSAPVTWTTTKGLELVIEYVKTT